ncbi:MAG: LysM peptidoglycan-binding domain-containing protein [Acidimicrobiia bacterium]|nr:LysM peptidoglycan-binding domain-containing protein [Acidimicrobiia bacterium]
MFDLDIERVFGFTVDTNTCSTANVSHPIHTVPTMTTNFPTTTTPELEIRRLTGRRPEWQRRRARTRLLTAIVTVAAVILGVVGTVDADTGPMETAEMRVTSGQTLWGIAEDLTEPGGDVRVVVRELMELNELTSSALRVGQVIEVPSGA